VKRVFVLTFALVCSALVVGVYAADNWYAVTFLRNATRFNLNFRYRFGPNDQWHGIKLAPGQWERFHYKYRLANQDKSPHVEVVVDTDTTHNIERREFTLVAHACPDIGECGIHYQFLADPTRHRLELVRESR